METDKGMSSGGKLFPECCQSEICTVIIRFYPRGLSIRLIKSNKRTRSNKILSPPENYVFSLKFELFFRKSQSIRHPGTIFIGKVHGSCL
jgi:hypothetical protein